jgi:hypothetical protein
LHAITIRSHETAYADTYTDAHAFSKRIADVIPLLGTDGFAHEWPYTVANVCANGCALIWAYGWAHPVADDFSVGGSDGRAHGFAHPLSNAVAIACAIIRTNANSQFYPYFASNFVPIARTIRIADASSELRTNFASHFISIAASYTHSDILSHAVSLCVTHVLSYGPAYILSHQRADSFAFAYAHLVCAAIYAATNTIAHTGSICAANTSANAITVEGTDADAHNTAIAFPHGASSANGDAVALAYIVAALEGAHIGANTNDNVEPNASTLEGPYCGPDTDALGRDSRTIANAHAKSNHHAFGRTQLWPFKVAHDVTDAIPFGWADGSSHARATTGI